MSLPQRTVYEIRWNEGHFADWQAWFRAWIMGGTLLTLIGFLMPWFKQSPDHGWAYGGWDLVKNEYDREPIVIVMLILYIVVLMITYFRLNGMVIATAAAAVVFASTLVIVFTAATTENTLQTLQVGLWLFVPGAAIMLVNAFMLPVTVLIRELTVLEKTVRADSPQN